MSRSNLDQIIHSVALLNNMRDIEATKIISSVYEYMAEEIKNTDHSEDDLTTNFYHKHLGTFHFRRDVYNRVIEAVNNKNKRNKLKENE
jgi:hypothetical protein|tara:strand:- start:1168 stop:1434 length:267 start_codon:yes stop_codon:yes gene_type:complete